MKIYIIIGIYVFILLVLYYNTLVYVTLYII